MHCIGVLESLIECGGDLRSWGRFFGFPAQNRNSSYGGPVPTGQPNGDPVSDFRLGTGLPVGGISRTLVLAKFEIFRVLP